MTDNNAQHEQILLREERKIERNKAKAEAFKENMIKTLIEMLKDDYVKKELEQEGKNAVRNPGNRNPLFDKAGNGTYRNDGEPITGLEPRPWEKD